MISDQLRAEIYRHLGPKINQPTSWPHGGRGYPRYRDHSLDDLAKASGCGASQISKFMRKECNLSMEKFDKLCKFLKLKLVR